MHLQPTAVAQKPRLRSQRFRGGQVLEVIVAGGSIAGVCGGIALREIGCNVEIYERTVGMTSRGAGIAVQPQLLRLVRDVGATELPDR
jgi:2-polyprenyl-6-methoxyphenol hydroxylase-like FAD-dependent oxidoreductase